MVVRNPEHHDGRIVSIRATLPAIVKGSLFRLSARWLAGVAVGLGVIWLASHERERVLFQPASESVHADDWPQESQVELLADLVATAGTAGRAAAGCLFEHGQSFDAADVVRTARLQQGGWVEHSRAAGKGNGLVLVVTSFRGATTEDLREVVGDGFFCYAPD